MKRSSFFLAIICLLLPCIILAQKGKLIDAHATKETKALYKNLAKLSEKHTLFGHQHATEYGHGWEGEEGRSDVKSVTGSHPAVIGVDFSGFTASSLDDVKKNKDDVRKNVIETYNRGGVTTV